MLKDEIGENLAFVYFLLLLWRLLCIDAFQSKRYKTEVDYNYAPKQAMNYVRHKEPEQLENLLKFDKAALKRYTKQFVCQAAA